MKQEPLILRPLDWPWWAIIVFWVVDIGMIAGGLVLAFGLGR